MMLPSGGSCLSLSSGIWPPSWPVTDVAGGSLWEVYYSFVLLKTLVNLGNLFCHFVLLRLPIYPAWAFSLMPLLLFYF